MSDYVPKPGDVSIFKNTKKEEGDRRPDYDGKGIDLNGNDFRIALWVKEGKNGKFFSGKLDKPYVPPAGAEASESKPEVKTNDIPF